MKIKNDLKFKVKDKFYIILILVLVLTSMFLIIFDKKSSQIFLNYAKNENEKIVSAITTEVLKQINDAYNIENLITIRKNKNEEIEYIDFDDKKANEILFQSTTILNKKMSELEKNNFYTMNFYDNNNLIYNIPSGVMYNSSLLIDLGPKVPFKINFLGSTDNHIITSIKEYGINNVLVEIKLSMVIITRIIVPFKFYESENLKEFTLSTRMIQGKIPTYFGNTISKTY